MSGILILFCVWLVAGVIFHQLERRAPIMPGYSTGYPRRGYVADVIWTAVNGPGLSQLEKVVYTYLITIVPAWHDAMGHWSLWLQFLVVFLVNDFGRYWLHRWYHEFNLLWRVHRVHHTVVHMDAMSVFRHHVLEAVVKNGLLFLPLRLLGVEAEVFIVYSAIDVVKGYWHHANLRTYIGPLNYIFNSPELHWWHHSVDSKGMMANYGSVLSIWDWLFGTFYYPKIWPDKIGVTGMENFPEDFVGQLTSVRFSEEEALRRFGSGTSTAPDSSVPASVNIASSAGAEMHARVRG